MLSRNLPLYQSSSDCPTSGHLTRANVEAPTFGDGAFTEIWRRRKKDGTLFWLIVAAIVVAVGTLTWFAMPVPRQAARTAPSPNVLALPDHQRPRSPSDGFTTASAEGSRAVLAGSTKV